MVKAWEFETASVQAVLFTSHAVLSQQKVLADLLTHTGDRYNGAPTSLPLPDDAPLNVPRVLLRSADGTWGLNVAPTRIDSLWSPQSPNGMATEDALETIVTQSADVLAEYAGRNDIRPSRLALVLARGLAVVNPAQVLIDRFCNEESKDAPFNNSQSFEIHNHKRYEHSGIGKVINSWVRCRTGLVLGNPGIVVEQDLNTLEEEMSDNEFNPDDIRRFFRFVRPEANGIMRLYFPEKG